MEIWAIKRLGICHKTIITDFICSRDALAVGFSEIPLAVTLFSKDESVQALKNKFVHNKCINELTNSQNQNLLHGYKHISMCICLKKNSNTNLHTCMFTKLLSFIKLPLSWERYKNIIGRETKIRQTFQMISCFVSFLVTASIFGMLRAVDLRGSVQVSQFYLDNVSAEVCIAEGFTLCQSSFS